MPDAEATPPRRIVLVGFMGSGKSTVGPLVAQRLGWRFDDLDDLIEAQCGLRVPEIFRLSGEAAFRAEELRAARAAASLTDHVLATGGGAFAQPDTRAALQQGAMTVWLRCPLQTVFARLPAGDPSRPLAANRGIMTELFAARESAYRMADRTVDAEAAPDEVAQRIVEAVFGITSGRSRGPMRR
jgi:shikimate kinase